MAGDFLPIGAVECVLGRHDFYQPSKKIKGYKLLDFQQNDSRLDWFKGFRAEAAFEFGEAEGGLTAEDANISVGHMFIVYSSSV